MSLIELSKERARSKALLLQKISNNHKLDENNSIGNRQRDNSVLGKRHYNEINDESIEILLSICGQSSDRFREYFKDNVLNKSIIIESNSSKAAKASSKTNLRRERYSANICH